MAAIATDPDSTGLVSCSEFGSRKVKMAPKKENTENFYVLKRWRTLWKVGGYPWINVFFISVNLIFSPNFNDTNPDLFPMKIRLGPVPQW